MQLTINNQPVQIQALKLGQYVQVFSVLDELPKQINRLWQANQNDYLVIIPTLVITALPEIVRILAIATPLTEDELNQLNPNDIIHLIKAVIEVNDFEGVYQNLKSLFSPAVAKNSASTSGTTEPSTSSPPPTAGAKTKSPTSIPPKASS